MNLNSFASTEINNLSHYYDIFSFVEKSICFVLPQETKVHVRVN